MERRWLSAEESNTVNEQKRKAAQQAAKASSLIMSQRAFAVIVSHELFCVTFTTLESFVLNYGRSTFCGSIVVVANDYQQ